MYSSAPPLAWNGKYWRLRYGALFGQMNSFEFCLQTAPITVDEAEKNEESAVEVSQFPLQNYTDS